MIKSRVLGVSGQWLGLFVLTMSGLVQAAYLPCGSAVTVEGQKSPALVYVIMAPSSLGKVLLGKSWRIILVPPSMKAIGFTHP